MAFTTTKLSATAKRMVYLVASAGDAGGTIANATLLADAVAGPLKNALAASYANQAAMRDVFDGSSVVISVNPRVGAGVTIWTTDVDTDAVTTTKPEINVESPISPNPSNAYLVLEFINSPNQ